MMKRIFITISVLSLLLSCKSKQTVTQTKEKFSFELNHKFDKFVYDKPVNEIIVIEEPCDSTGKIKPFKERFKSNHADITIEAKDGQLRAEINIDSLKSEWLKQQRVKEDSEKERSEDKKVVYRWPWWVVYLIGYSVVLTGLSGYLLFKRLF